MRLFSVLILLFLFFQNSLVFADSTSNEASSESTAIEITAENCFKAAGKNLLIGGWYLWNPYQYNKMTPSGYKLTGMDIDIVNSLSENIGVEIKYDEIDWKQHQLDLKEGKRDIAAGATYTDERAKYVYFSIPYRFEENSLFVSSNGDKSLNFRTVPEYLAQLRLQNFRLGITRGFIYGDPQINEFVADSVNKDIIYIYDNDVQSVQALLKGEIDGFMSDRVVGASIILNKVAGDKVKEIPLDVKTPIHLMFSRKSVPLETVDYYNQQIKTFTHSAEYKAIAKTYLYPILLLETIGAEWFYIVGIIGTIAFALSGVAIAAKENSTLFGTFLFAMLPSVGGGILRDVILNRETIGIILTPSYMYYIIFIVIIGFTTIRLLDYYNHDAAEDNLVNKFWQNLLVVCDALGQATFIVMGVSIVMMARIEPLILWGAFFAFLTANGGGILRDLIRKDRVISCITDGINAEISIIWGVIFSFLLDYSSYNPNPTTIRYYVIGVVTGAFLTRLLVYYLKIPNLHFRNETTT